MADKGIKLGDFSELAASYANRAGYSHQVLKAISSMQDLASNQAVIADVGAGTGKLTQDLAALGFRGFAVEPNDAMRAEGVAGAKRYPEFQWIKGSAEATGLESASVAWVLMGSSFHWTRPAEALREFRRILRPGGWFTAIWNPRAIENSELHQRIEKRVYEFLPNMKRVSSGAKEHLSRIEETLLSDGLFGNLVQIEAPHEVVMTPERYMGAWKSVNDIQAQAGPERFRAILDSIEQEIRGMKEIVVPYRIRSWSVQARE